MAKLIEVDFIRKKRIFTYEDDDKNKKRANLLVIREMLNNVMILIIDNTPMDQKYHYTVRQSFTSILKYLEKKLD